MDSAAHINNRNRRSERPKTYFDLIERVGSDGKYQFNMFLIFLLVWFVTGIILMNTSFLFLNQTFACKKKGLLTTDCNQYVCTLPQKQWENFIVISDGDFKSIATDTGPFYCDDQFYLDIAKSSAYLGSFLGFIVFSILSDNLGRRKSMLLALLATAIGTVVLSISQNLVMAGIGLILSGAGANSSIGMTFYFLGQCVQNQKRQKYSILIQISFTIGAILVTGLNYMIPNWQVVTIISVTIPSIISLFLVFLYVEQTPQFLLRKTNSQALKALNRIGKINYQIKQIIEQEDLLSVKDNQLATQQFNQITVTPFDLLKYGSLRSITICLCIVCFIIYALYYGPVLVVEEIGFDIYVSNVIIQLSELVIFLPAYYYIQEMKRKFMGLMLFGIAFLCSGILIFVEKPEDCEMCVQSVIELIVIFIFRAAISMYFALFFLYVNELYPARVTGIGLGIVSAVGIIATTISPIILGILKKNNFNVMIIFCALSILAMGVTNLMDETLGKPIKPQIQQIQMLKEKRKTQIPVKGSFRRSSMVKSSSFHQKKANSPVIKSQQS